MPLPLRIVVALPGVLFLLMGINWLLNPSGAAEALGMPLLDGSGLSTQMGDLGAFFTSSGAMILIGVFTQNRTWLLAPAMLMGLTAIFRTVAWGIYGADLAAEAIAAEVIVCVLLLLAARKVTPT